MRAISWLPVIAVVAGLCVGCADPSLESDADELRTEVTGLPGVASAVLDYTVPVPLDSGKVDLRVTMSEGATAAEVVAVTEAAYTAFSTTHHGEEADLAVRAGDTTLALRSFEPDASVTAVGDAVRTGLTAAPVGGSVAMDLTTQDVSQGDHVAGTYIVGLPEGTTAADVPAFLAALATRQPENRLVGWGGRAADGASISYDVGFPPEPVLDRWERAQSAELPLAVRAFEDGSLFAEGRLTRRYDVSAARERRALDRITRPQLRALGEGPWVYDLLGPNGGYLASVDRYICVSTSEGRYDDRLEAWVRGEFGECEET